MKETLMAEAFKEAEKSSEPIKCGAVIVKDGAIIGRGFNRQRLAHDVSAHAEINAIRNAGKQLKSKNLEGCSMYSTHEPCLMCLAAIAFARISRLNYAKAYEESWPNEKVRLPVEEFLEKTGYPFKAEQIRDAEKREITL